MPFSRPLLHIDPEIHGKIVIIFMHRQWPHNLMVQKAMSIMHEEKLLHPDKNLTARLPRNAGLIPNGRQIFSSNLRWKRQLMYHMLLFSYFPWRSALVVCQQLFRSSWQYHAPARRQMRRISFIQKIGFVPEGHEHGASGVLTALHTLLVASLPVHMTAHAHMPPLAEASSAVFQGLTMARHALEINGEASSAWRMEYRENEPKCAATSNFKNRFCHKLNSEERCGF